MTDQERKRNLNFGSAKDVADETLEFSKNLGSIAKQSQQVLGKFLKRQAENLNSGTVHDPMHISKAFRDLFQEMMKHPGQMLEGQVSLWSDHMRLWQSTARKLAGQTTDPVIKPTKSDKRFRHDGWEQNIVYDYIKQSYLLTTNWVQHMVETVDQGLDPMEARRIEFFTQQYMDMVSPSNFVLTNPEVLEATINERGQNLVRGLQNLMRDLEAGDGNLLIRQTDLDAFELGHNLALTPGKVVYQNDLMQLIQYEPVTKTVYKRPLLIFPPWINKYYILDLQQKNSFIKWMTEQGYTVFIVSWANPDKKTAEKTFEDYMFEGVFGALDAIEQATGEKDVTAIGYCIGGTLLSAALAYMAQVGDTRIKAATFFAAQNDFKHAGDLQIFIDEYQVSSLEDDMNRHDGLLEGSTMATTFNMLRSNDLIWSFVVNNYLLGKDPFPFDLLYWNGDTTNMPHNMHSFYLRECYMKNTLSEGKMVMGGKELHLSDVKIPIFMQSSKEDHIAPAKSVFASAKNFGGQVTFLMAGSGHIAGVINHPDAKKYQYWWNDQNCQTLDEWRDGAVEHPGSWWPQWHKWLSRKSGKKVPARKPGDGKLQVIEPAPGSYVMRKA